MLLYELLTGQKPFVGPTPVAYIQQHLNMAAPSLAERRAGLPDALDRTIQRAMAKVPTARFASVDELVAEVRAQRRLAQMAAEWETSGRDPSFLATGTRLSQVSAWTEGATMTLNQVERAFLDASVTQAQHDTLKREAQRQRELEAARQLAREQVQRAEEQTHAAKSLRRRAL